MLEFRIESIHELSIDGILMPLENIYHKDRLLLVMTACQTEKAIHQKADSLNTYSSSG